MTEIGSAGERAWSLCRRGADRSRLRRVLQRSLVHELRQPLNAAALRLDLLAHLLGQDGAGGEERWQQLETLEALRGEVRRLDAGLAELQPLPEPGSDRRETIDLAVILPRLLRLLHRRVGALPGVKLNEEVAAGEHPVVSIDAGVEHAFLSIALNALEAMPDGGTLDLRVRSEEGKLSWEVEDEGAGIPVELGESIFDPFVSTKEGHAGLGLPVAREMLREHDGEIRVTARPTGGTRVEVQLPLAAPATAAPEDRECRTPS